ncbi:MAG: molybdopterin-dependent oxidoreductase [Bryobacterales bacterium]|nr:molybdopterin-dependent oxidoreductase [Bryobacterales bacterium]
MAENRAFHPEAEPHPGKAKRAYRERTEFAPESIAPERFEHFTAPRHEFGLSRRAFWQSAGTGILLTVCFPLRAQERKAGEASLPEEISSRFLFEESGRITGFTGKVELGQGSRTLLSQAMAEEFFVPVARVSLVMGDTGRVPDDGGTWASLTSPQTVPVVRGAAAFARALFVAAAAKAWSANAADLRLQDGEVLGRAGLRMTLFAAAKIARETPIAPVPERAMVASRDWKALGQSAPPVRGREIVTGAPLYASDVQVPGMLFGAMVRGPHYRAKIERIRGVDRLPVNVQVVHDGDFLGVVAPDAFTAHAAAQSLGVVWDASMLVPEAKLAEHFKETAKAPVFVKGARYPALLEKGDAYNGYFAAPRKRSATYATAYIAHVPLETSSAIAAWEGDRLTVHYGCQAPFLTMELLAKTFGIPEENVRVIASDTGSAFGGKQGGAVAVEAARLAREAGKPVKLCWSRDDEFQANYFRPAALVEVRSGADLKGQIQAFDFHNYNSGASGLPIPYEFPNYYLGYHPASSPLRQGSYRALAAVANTFARELHMEEWAAELREDSIAFRLRHIGDARLKEAITRGAERFGWGKSASRLGVAQGMACTIEKDARLAFFVEVKAGGRDVKVLRALMVFDPGAVLNPDNLRNQITGNVIQAIGPALYERVLWDDTRLRTRRLNQYRVPRFSDAPLVDVELIDRREIPAAGAGESPNTVVAPAIAAAIHRATGVWVRSLPLLPALAEALEAKPQALRPRNQGA